MLLGSLRFGPDLDVWSLGCVAAELFLRVPLFQPIWNEVPERSLLDAHFAFLGTPPSGTSTNAWMKSLPFFWKFYGSYARRLPVTVLPAWPPEQLRGCQPRLTDFVRQTLQWRPHERMAAASACLH